MSLESQISRRVPFAVWAKMTAGAAFLLLIAGSLVTSTKSGLAVPDWPLSYGRFFPPMRGGILFEHGHRMVAGVVGVMTLILAVWVWVSSRRRSLRVLALAAAGGILVQALLGGLTVLMRLPPAVSIAHACLAQLVFCLLLSMAYLSSSKETSQERACSWSYPLFVGSLAFVQLFLGAILRHTGHGLPFHLLGAVVLAGAISWAAYGLVQGQETPGPQRRLIFLLMGLWPAQVLFGLLALTAVAHSSIRSGFWSAAFPSLHVAVGALILGVSVLWMVESVRTK